MNEWHGLVRLYEFPNSNKDRPTDSGRHCRAIDITTNKKKKKRKNQQHVA